MTKLEELKAALDAAYDAACDRDIAQVLLDGRVTSMMLGTLIWLN